MPLAHKGCSVEKVIRIKDVADRTGLPVWAVRQYVREGVIKSGQPGGKNRAVWIPEGEADRLRALLEGTK